MFQAFVFTDVYLECKTLYYKFNKLASLNYTVYLKKIKA